MTIKKTTKKSPRKTSKFSSMFTDDNKQPPEPIPVDNKRPRLSQSKPPHKTTPKSRIGKKGVIFYPQTEAKTQLKILSAELGITQDALLIEALNLLFKKHNKSTIA